MRTYSGDCLTSYLAVTLCGQGLSKIIFHVGYISSREFDLRRKTENCDVAALQQCQDRGCLARSATASDLLEFVFFPVCFYRVGE